MFNRPPSIFKVLIKFAVFTLLTRPRGRLRRIAILKQDMNELFGQFRYSILVQLQCDIKPGRAHIVSHFFRILVQSSRSIWVKRFVVLLNFNAGAHAIVISQ